MLPVMTEYLIRRSSQDCAPPPKPCPRLCRLFHQTHIKLVVASLRHPFAFWSSLDGRHFLVRSCNLIINCKTAAIWILESIAYVRVQFVLSAFDF